MSFAFVATHCDHAGPDSGSFPYTAEPATRSHRSSQESKRSLTTEIYTTLPATAVATGHDSVLHNKAYCSEDQSRLNYSLDLIVTWCQNEQMCLNFDKAVFMSVTLKRRPFWFNNCANNIPITQVKVYKYLGVFPTSDIRWNKHIDVVSSRALNKVYFLRRHFTFATADAKISTYITLLYPITKYRNVVWGPYTSTNTTKLTRIQNRAVRFTFHEYSRHTSVSLLTENSGLISLGTKLRINRLNVLHQVIYD